MSELKQYHNQTVYTGGINCPYLRTSVVLASDAEAALVEKDAEIARLRKALKSIASGCYTRETAAFMAKDALEARDDIS